MITPIPYVVFREPVTLNLRLGQRSRVVPPGGPPANLPPPIRRVFPRLPLHLQIDSAARKISAYLMPIPGSILLYGPDDFAAACADSMADHCARVLELLGSDPAAALQQIIDGTQLGEPPPRKARRISKLKLRRALRDAGLESLLDGFLANNPTAAADWNDSQLLMVADPLLAESLPLFAAAAGMTIEQISDLLQACQDTP